MNKKGKMQNPENDFIYIYFWQYMCVKVCVLNLIIQWEPGSGKF